MSDQTTKSGPALTENVQEVQGVFAADAAMQDAVAKLTLAGFDRADLSLPKTSPAANEATPSMGAENVVTDTDMRQVRTMGTSMAGTVGAIAAAGATIATGGAAGLVIAAAAAVGTGAALTANAAGNAADDAQSDAHDEAAADGTLVLAVHAPTAEKQATAEKIMRDAGATEVGVVASTEAAHGVDSTSWTG